MTCLWNTRALWIAILRGSGLAILAGVGCIPESHFPGFDPEPDLVVAVRLTPDSADLELADTLRFRATAVNARGEVQTAPGVTFQATGGTIDGAGLFHAIAEGDFEVRAVLGSGATQLVGLARGRVKKPVTSRWSEMVGVVTP